MGYRLEISKIEYAACGGKLFGYIEDVTKLRSHKWLLEREFIDGEEYWSYGCNPQIILDRDEFKEFIKLYIEDVKEFDSHPYQDDEYFKELLELSETKTYKLLEWW